MRDVVVRKGNKHHNNNIGRSNQQSNFLRSNVVGTSKRVLLSPFQRAPSTNT